MYVWLTNETLVHMFSKSKIKIKSLFQSTDTKIYIAKLQKQTTLGHAKPSNGSVVDAVCREGSTCA